MFTFSDQEYKWCPECCGNVRKDAYCCKFCHSRIGSRLLQAKQPQNLGGFITDASHWLPAFSSVVKSLPEELRARIEEADRNTVVPYIGIRDGVDPIEHQKQTRDSNICHPYPPTEPVMGFVWDILIIMCAQGQSLTAICADPRLQLLEISPGEIAAEYQLRTQESESGHSCKHCAEFIQVDDELCRFCGGTAENAPGPGDPMRILMADFTRFDPTLLRSVLLWEAATRRINAEPPIDAEVLSDNRITADDVDRQILALKQKPDLMPCSRWRQRMVDLGITPGYYDSEQFGLDFDHFMLEDITVLADALTPDYKKRDCANAQEAMIVLDHGLNRWRNHRHFGNHKHRLLQGKGSVYLHLKDDENYQRLKSQADEALLEMVPEDVRGMMKERLDASKSPLIKGLSQSDDPEQRLQALENVAQQFAEEQSRQVDQVNKLIPGLGDALKGISDVTNQSLLVTKHILKGQSALQKNDPESACIEFQTAIDMLADSVFNIGRRANLFLDLGGAQLLKGDKKAAKESFNNAFSDAANVLEADGDPFPTSQAHHKFACFLRDTGDYSSAEEHFNKAFSFYVQMVDRMVEKGWMPATTARESWVMKADYAKLLHATGREAEAKLAEEQSAELKAKDVKKQR